MANTCLSLSKKQLIGGPAAAKVVKVGVHPVKLPQGGEAAELIAELQGVMANSPPPWLAKVMGITAERRFLLSLDGSN